MLNAITSHKGRERMCYDFNTGFKTFNLWMFLMLIVDTDIDWEDDDIECNLPLLDNAVLSATSFLNEREPKNARLHGEYRVYFIDFFFVSCVYLGNVFFYDFDTYIFVYFL